MVIRIIAMVTFGGLLIRNGYKDVFWSPGNVVCLNACI